MEKRKRSFRNPGYFGTQYPNTPLLQHSSFPVFPYSSNSLAYKLENGLLKLVESLEQKESKETGLTTDRKGKQRYLWHKESFPIFHYSITPILQYIIDSITPIV